jgi:hypothetical protein
LKQKASIQDQLDQPFRARLVNIEMESNTCRNHTSLPFNVYFISFIFHYLGKINHIEWVKKLCRINLIREIVKRTKKKILENKLTTKYPSSTKRQEIQNRNDTPKLYWIPFKWKARVTTCLLILTLKYSSINIKIKSNTCRNHSSLPSNVYLVSFIFHYLDKINNIEWVKKLCKINLIRQVVKRTKKKLLENKPTTMYPPSISRHEIKNRDNTPKLYRIPFKWKPRVTICLLIQTLKYSSINTEMKSNTFRNHTNLPSNIYLVSFIFHYLDKINHIKWVKILCRINLIRQVLKRTKKKLLENKLITKYSSLISR